jgi:Zn/Cd-binding protein ZinT
MAMSTDDDLLKYQPEILNYGIDEFTEEHAKARADILRKLRSEWWNKAKTYNAFPGNSKYAEMDETKLTESQFNRVAVFRVLSEYVLPQLTKWNNENEEDKFQVMMKHYEKRYKTEFAEILLDGVEYDFDGDGTVQDDERGSIHSKRLTR